MKINTRKLIIAAIVGGLYAVLTFALSPLSYGPLQFRISEALCVLPYFMPYTAWGLFVGCALANLVSAAGILDITFGSLATLLSCLCVAALGKRRPGLGSQLAACAMPVLWNSVIVGAVLCYAFTDLAPWNNLIPFLIYAGDVALGEAVVMFVLGLPLLRYLPKTKLL